MKNLTKDYKNIFIEKICQNTLIDFESQVTTKKMAYIPSPYSGSAQKTIFVCHTAEQLVGSGWGASAKTLQTAALSLVYATTEYYVPFWCRSAHTRLIDAVVNDALHIVTGCLHPLQRTTYPYFQASSQMSFFD